VIVPMSEAAARSLRTGSNLIAVHGSQEKGAQAVDAGILRIR